MDSTGNGLAVLRKDKVGAALPFLSPFLASPELSLMVPTPRDQGSSIAKAQGMVTPSGNLEDAGVGGTEGWGG
jgi:hypothetical protein